MPGKASHVHMSQSHEHTPDSIAASLRRLTAGFSPRNLESASGDDAPSASHTESYVVRTRAPVAGEPSIDPHDSWAPVILPVAGVRKREGTGSWYQDRLFGAAIDSLGYPGVRHWDESLQIAEALSLGAPTLQSAAESIGTTIHVARGRLAELRSIIGNLPEPALVDFLLREQFLKFSIQASPPYMNEALSQKLFELIGGNLDPDEKAYTSLYSALRCQPTPSAAVRRAYEWQILTPLGVPSARRIGFHLLRNVEGIPLSYPGQPPLRSTHKRAWNVTKLALEGKVSPSVEYAPPGELSPAQLAVASLVALGCDNYEIGERIGSTGKTVGGWLTEVAPDPFDGRREGRTRRLFESGTLFVTQSSIESPRQEPT